MQASVLSRTAMRFTHQQNPPIKIPHAAAISSNTPQPPAGESPPCTLSTVAIHGTEVRTNAMACINPHKKSGEGKRKSGSGQRRKKCANRERHFPARLWIEKSEPASRGHQCFTMPLKPADSMLLRAASAAFWFG